MRACDFCGLPVPGTSGTEHSTPDTDLRYCCYGCEFAAKITQERGEAGAASWTLTKLGLGIFFTLNVLAFTMALWTDPPAPGAELHRLETTLNGLMRYLGLLFSLPVLILLGKPLLESAWEGLLKGRYSTDLLLATGVLASFLYSVVSVYRDQGDVYFEVGCVVLVMVTLGRWFEANGKLTAIRALSDLERLFPETVRIINGGTESLRPLAEATAGQTLRILAGERFPTDGVLQSERVSVDQQVLTGESLPVVKHRGDTILGGTLNLDGDVLVQSSSSAQLGTFGRMIELMRQARLSQGHYQRTADRVSAWFMPVVSLLALGALTVHGVQFGIGRGLMVGLSVVLIACPCALGLATPLAVWVGFGEAAKRQVLFRSGEALERLAGIRAIRFDKTGTLTTGLPRVVRWTAHPATESKELLSLAAWLAASSSHALSRGITNFCTEKGIAAVRSAERGETRTIAGRGIAGKFDVQGGTTEVLMGNARFMEESGIQLGALREAIETGSALGSPMCILARDGQCVGVFEFDEEIRPHAREALQWCVAEGLDTAVLTGDHSGRARRLAEILGVPVVSDMLPEQKLENLRETRSRSGGVAMVGDGINDGPALAEADVGISLGSGTDLSRETAGVCLLSDELTRVPWGIQFARKIVRTIRLNLMWAFGYNAVGMILACSGWMNPAFAAAVMVLSSVLVIGNSLALRSVIVPGLQTEEAASHAAPVDVKHSSQT